MTRTERESFLAETRIGVLIVDEPGRGPCATPVWYKYTPGSVVQITVAPTSRKIRLLREAGRASFCVQSEVLPYRYVTVEGSIELEDVDVRAHQREMAVRYLGPDLAERYLAAREGLKEISLQLRPQHWRSVDYSKFGL